MNEISVSEENRGIVSFLFPDRKVYQDDGTFQFIPDKKFIFVSENRDRKFDNSKNVVFVNRLIWKYSS